MENYKTIYILGYVKCIETDKDEDYIVGKMYPILSTNNGISILSESQESIGLFHNFGDELIMIYDGYRNCEATDRKVVMKEK